MAKKFNLKIWIPVAAVIVALIAGVTVVLGSSTTVALLNVEEGNVEVDTGDGWQKAQDGMELGLSDRVRTTTGKAVLILYESVIVQLDQETEVTIEELSRKNTRLRQSSGKTWNKFAAISGLQSFEVETPTTVATVRGTDFWVDMESVGVSEGNVDVKMNGKLLKVASGKKAVLRQNIGKIESISPEEVKKVIEKKERIVSELKDLRQRELEKHSSTVQLVKKLRGWTDEDIMRYMEKLDRGEYDEEELRRKIILPSDAVDKFARITKEIRKEKAAIESMKSRNTDALQRAPADDIQSRPQIEETGASPETPELRKAAIASEEETSKEPEVAADTDQERIAAADLQKIETTRLAAVQK